MNGQDPRTKSTHSHGIRMLRGAVADSPTKVDPNPIQIEHKTSNLKVCVSEEKAALDATIAVRKKTLRNPLLMKLNALANALDDEVLQILKL